MEEWKDIKGFEGKYMVSSYGNIYSLLSKKNLKPTIDSDGYCIVGLFNNGKQTKKKVHRLVAEAFIFCENSGLQINHKDEDKTNNKVENLEWCDGLYNINYGNRNDKVAKALKNNPNKRRDRIEKLDKDGNLIKIYETLRSVEEDGYGRWYVYLVCTGKKKTYKDFIWRYIR